VQAGLGHETVFLDEAVEALALRRDGCYLDCTFGRGGHSAAILARLGPDGRLLALDRDPEAVAVGRTWTDPRFAIEHARFSELDAALDAQRIDLVDGVLFDLGVSSPQLDDPARGFSFRASGPLDMRMDPTRGIPARQWLLEASEDEIAKVVSDYGEERFAVPIAKAIVARRGELGADALRTTGELAALVAAVVRRRGRAQVGKDPATRTFQALRIPVNQELEELPIALDRAVGRLQRGGRLVVISFHSLEDRMVKQFIAAESGRDALRDPVTGASVVSRIPRLRALSRRLASETARGATTDALAATDASARDQRRSRRRLPENPRARSAVMRVAERI